MKKKKDDDHSSDSAEHIPSLFRIESGEELDFHVSLMFYNLLLLLYENISLFIVTSQWIIDY